MRRKKWAEEITDLEKISKGRTKKVCELQHQANLQAQPRREVRRRNNTPNRYPTKPAGLGGKENNAGTKFVGTTITDLAATRRRESWRLPA